MTALLASPASVSHRFEPADVIDHPSGYLALSPRNVTTNVPRSVDDYYTWEVTANKRLSHRWSLLATSTTSTDATPMRGSVST